jgi:superfamily II DNA helicase RecQ
MRTAGLDRAEGFGCGKDLEGSVAERLVQELVLKKFLAEESRETGGGYSADYLSLGPQANALLGSHPPQVVVKFRTKGTARSAPKSAKTPKLTKAQALKASQPRAGPGPAYDDDDDDGDDPEDVAMLSAKSSKTPKPRQERTPKPKADKRDKSQTTSKKAKQTTPPKGYSGTAASAYAPGGVMEMVNAMSDDGSSSESGSGGSGSGGRGSAHGRLARRFETFETRAAALSSSAVSAAPAASASKHFLAPFQAAAIPPSAKVKASAVGRLGSKSLENLLSTFLHQWLDAYGAEHNIATFNIADSKAVLELVKYVPQTRGDLKQLNGWGAHKLSTHGDLILTQIETFLDEHHVELVGSFVAPGLTQGIVGLEDDDGTVAEEEASDGEAAASAGEEAYPGGMADTGGGGSDFEEYPWD